MGAICDMNDLDRFLRSREGKAELKKQRKMLVGRTITDVEFSNETGCISMTLRLDDGETYEVYPPSLEVDAIRSEFADVIEREYYVDYPERKKEKEK